MENENKNYTLDAAVDDYLAQCDWVCPDTVQHGQFDLGASGKHHVGQLHNYRLRRKLALLFQGKECNQQYNWELGLHQPENIEWGH
jgi:hypothetical protein